MIFGNILGPKMIAELGHFALVLAFCAAIVQMIIPMIGASRGWKGWMDVCIPTSNVQFLLTAFSFGALMWAFIVSDFSVELVALNSHSAKPMIFKVSGTWGNHEGSLLLWVLILTLFGVMVAWWGGGLPSRLRARVLSVQASVSVAFFAFLLFTSNPFLRLENPPIDGNDLNPLLQDIGLAFHPPFLYLGYVGLSMAFSFAVAALIEGRVDAAWARWVRPWTLAAWVFLTIGIAIGSWWAYYELGWGGWWFWDPVENASFMPWLVAAALLHSAIVVEKRESLKSWTILLAILAFSFSLIGTFIVRSGVITSVHAFATDPTRGVFILGILVFFIGGALTLYALRASSMQAKGVFGLVSRESGLVVNNLLLSVSAAIVLVGYVVAAYVRAVLGAQGLSRGTVFQCGIHTFHGGPCYGAADWRDAALETRSLGAGYASAMGRAGLVCRIGCVGLGHLHRRPHDGTDRRCVGVMGCVRGNGRHRAADSALGPTAARFHAPIGEPATRRHGQICCSCRIWSDDLWNFDDHGRSKRRMCGSRDLATDGR